MRNEQLAAKLLFAWRDNPVGKRLQVIASIHTLVCIVRLCIGHGEVEAGLHYAI